MTTTASCSRWAQIGVQSAVGTAATPLTHIDFVDNFYPKTDIAKIERNDLRYDGEFAAAITGPKSASAAWKMFVRGGGTAAGNGTAMTATFEVAPVLDCLFGAAATCGTGVTSGSSHDTDTIKLAATANWPVGAGILIDSLDSGTRYEAREVASVSENVSVDLDRALQGTPANASVAYAGCRWSIDPDLVTRSAKHLTLDVEGDSWRRVLIDGMPKVVLVIPASGPATFEIDCGFGDWSDSAEANPTYAANYDTNAVPLMGNGSTFWLGATKTDLVEGKLDFGLAPTPHTSVNGTNGLSGFDMIYQGATFAGKIYDDNDTTLTAFQAGTTYDIALQIGATGTSTTPGNCLYVRIPVLEVTGAQREDYNGVDVISFTGRARRPTTGGSVRLHLFGLNAA